MLEFFSSPFYAFKIVSVYTFTTFDYSLSLLFLDLPISRVFNLQGFNFVPFFEYAASCHALADHICDIGVKTLLFFVQLLDLNLLISLFLTFPVVTIVILKVN